MKKHIRKILVLGGVLMFMLVGCAHLKGKQYDTITLAWRGDLISINVPVGTPDLANIDSGYMIFQINLSEHFCIVVFQNETEQYDFLAKRDSPEILTFSSTISGEKTKWWIYKDGIPIESTEEAIDKFLDDLVIMELEERKNI